MIWRNWLLIFIIAISMTAGGLYINDSFFSFGFLGHEAGSEWGTVLLWGRCSIGLAIILLVTLLLRKKMKHSANDIMLIIVLFLLCAIQFPPFVLWFFTIFFGSISGLIAVVIHFTIVFLSITVVRLARRSITSHS